MLIAGLLLSLLCLNSKDMSKINTLEEIWKPIKGYEGYYEISTFGRVKSICRTIMRKNGNPQTFKERILIPVVNNYYQVFLAKNGSRRYYIHSLVAKTFIPNPDSKPEVNHIDGNKLNNQLDNLEWVTVKENRVHAVKTGLYKSGGEHHRAKEVIQMNLEGVEIKRWACLSDIFRELGLKQGNVSSACLGTLKTAYGYKWKYV